MRCLGRFGVIGLSASQRDPRDAAVSCNGEQRGTDLERVRRVVGSQSRAAELTFDDVRPAGRCGRGGSRRRGPEGNPP